MALRTTGWKLKITDLFQSKSKPTDTNHGQWLEIINIDSGGGHILRLSSLGVHTISGVDPKLGLGLNKHGCVRPIKGNADWKFVAHYNLLSSIEFDNTEFKLYIDDDYKQLKLTENGSFVLVLNGVGLWRYAGYHGLAHKTDEMISIIRTQYNVNPG